MPDERTLLTSGPTLRPPAASDRSGGRLRVQPFHLLLAVAAVALAVRTATPLVDTDVYWHVVVGREILDTGRIAGAGDGWAWYDPPQPWVTSQWLAEVGIAALVDAVGWRGLVVAKLLLSLTLFWGLWLVLRRRADVRISAIVTAGVVIPSIPFLQDRPSLLSLVATVAVAHVADRTLDRGRLLSWWWVPATVLWANLHGQWFLLPLVLLTASALHASGRPPGTGRFLRAQGLRLLAVLAAGCLTPLGVAGLTLPFVFRTTTAHLGEWQTPALFGVGALAVVFVMVGFALAWSRGRFAVPLREVVYVLGWLTFGVMAGRNLPVAAILLAPVLTRHLAAVFPTRPRQVRPREARLLAATIGLVAVVGAAATMLALAVVDPLRDTRALAIARALASRPGQVTIFNDYNVAGPLVAFGPPGAVLVIDGRAERFGPAYVERHDRAVGVAGEGWAGLLDEMDPDVVVVEEESPLRHVLVAERGWQQTQRDGDYVLLEPARGTTAGRAQPG